MATAIDTARRITDWFRVRNPGARIRPAHEDAAQAVQRSRSLSQPWPEDPYDEPSGGFLDRFVRSGTNIAENTGRQYFGG